MKKILLTVIFFLLCLILFLIYNKFNTNNLNILYIGENNTYYKYLSSTKYFINKYTYDTITYKDIKNEIINNSVRVIKDKNVYLNQLISKSDIIVLNANNFKYNKKCNKSSKIIKEYDNIVFNEINELSLLINKISNSKIYIIGNYCSNNNKIKQNISFENIYYIGYDNADDIYNIIEKTAYYR